MYEENPPKAGNAQPATSLAGSEAAAGFGLGNTENGSGLDAEIDGYGELLAALGREEAQDERIAAHEVGHLLALRLLDWPVESVTITPGEIGGSSYEGRVSGPRYGAARAKNDDALASEICDVLCPTLPLDGESRASVADIFQSVLDQCVASLAGETMERLLLDSQPQRAGSDRRQAAELASLICKSPEAVEQLISLAEIMAEDLLRPYGLVAIVLTTALKIRRTLSGSEADEIIANTLAGLGRAEERTRRAEWRQRELSADRFTAEYHHADDSPLPHRGRDQLERLHKV